MMRRRRDLFIATYTSLYMIAGSLATKAPLPYTMPDIEGYMKRLRECHVAVLNAHDLPTLTG